MIQAKAPTPLPVSSPGNRAINALSPARTTRHLDPSTPPRTACLRTELPFPLVRGGELAELRLVYELSGPPGAPLVVALGGISAGRHVVATPEDPTPGWWTALAGPGQAVDPRQVRILSFDWVGGNGDSSGPRSGIDGVLPGAFPAVDSHDQSNALALLLDHLGEPRVDLLLGASYGGMVALAFAADHPERLGRVVVISAADRPHPRSTAWRTIQRRIVELAGRGNAWAEGLSLARGLAMTTYRSADELAERFGGSPGLTREGSYRFPVEAYLDSRGEVFANTFHPQAFLCLSQSIDLHRVDPERIAASVTLVAVTTDELVPSSQLRRLAIEIGPETKLVEIDSRYGHDAFLKEAEALGAIVAPIVSSIVSSPATGTASKLDITPKNVVANEGGLV